MPSRADVIDAIRKRDVERLKSYLSVLGAEVLWSRPFPTPLASAVWTDDQSLLDVVLPVSREHINDPEGKGVTLLMAAAVGAVGDTSVRSLISAGANVDAQDRSGMTALMKAAFYGQLAAIEALLQAGAQIDLRTPVGWTALTYAAYGNQLDAVRLLLEHGVDTGLEDENGNTALTWATLRGSDPICDLIRSYDSP